VLSALAADQATRIPARPLLRARSMAVADIGRANRKPCAEPQPSRESTSASRSVSTPSATTSTPRLRDRPMIAATILALSARSCSVRTKERDRLNRKELS
jgi:hypothetical protein